jgi:hypothetical protein
MPEKETRRRAQQDRKAGKAPSTQAGEYVREEIDHIREGKHGARSAKQAIAIGLSKARRDGVDIPENPKAKSPTRTKRSSATPRRKSSETSSKRAAAAEKALKKEPRSAGSHRALSRQAHAAAKKRPAASRSAAAKKAARTRAAEAR